MTEYIIDAQNKKLGRVASEAASILRGKNTPTFTPNLAPDVKVTIRNASGIEISPKKLNEVYDHYSGYPGGRKVVPRSRVIEKKGYQAVFKEAIRRMLPNNKLRSIMMKNLEITE